MECLRTTLTPDFSPEMTPADRVWQAMAEILTSPSLKAWGW